MPAARHDFSVDQGATFSRVVAYQNPDGSVFPLTGYTARMQVRQRHGSASPLLTLTPAVNGAAGTVTITMTAAETAALPPGRCVYDLELVAPDTSVIRLIEGALLVDAEVTRV